MRFDDYLSLWLKKKPLHRRILWYCTAFLGGLILRIEIAFNAIFKRGAK